MTVGLHPAGHSFLSVCFLETLDPSSDYCEHNVKLMGLLLKNFFVQVALDGSSLSLRTFLSYAE